MQSLKDAAVVLGLLLLIVSVKVAPIDAVGDIIPSAEAASTGSEDGVALAGFSADTVTPAARHEQAPVQLQVEADVHRCDSSIVHVQTVELGGTGDRIILRIDTKDGQAQVERIEAVEPAPRMNTLEACKIG